VNPVAGYRDAAMRMNGIAEALESGASDVAAARAAAIECLEGVGVWVHEPSVHAALAGLISRIRGSESVGVDGVRELATVLERMSLRAEEFQATLRSTWG